MGKALFFVIIGCVLIFIFPAYPKEEKALPLALRDENGKLHLLSEILEEKNTKIVLIAFVSESCKECKEETEFHRELIRRFGDKGLIVVYIAVGKKEKDLEGVKKKLNVPEGVLLLADKFGVAAEDWRIGNMFPQTFLVRKDGTVKLHVYGNTLHDHIRKMIIEEVR